MTTYKGTDRAMTCRGFQYELGKKFTWDGAVRCGDRGGHSVVCPMDALSYYSPVDGSRYFECEAGGTIDGKNNVDSKIASSELTLKSEIGLDGLIKEQFDYVKQLAEGNAAQGDRGHAAAQGEGGHAAALGYRGHAAAQGDRGHAAAQGDWGHAVTQGYRGHAAAQGYGGHAEVHGADAIAAVFGIDGEVMAGKVGAWLTAYEWDYDGSDWHIKAGKCVRVDGEKIKPNVWYTLKNGEFVEVEE